MSNLPPNPPGYVLIGRHLADAVLGRIAEWASAVLLIVTGTILTSNRDIFISATGMTYTNLADIWPQATWAIVLLILGTLRITVLVINGWWRRSPHARMVTAGLAGFVWLQFAIAAAPAFALLFAFSSTILLMDFANIIRAASDARRVDDVNREAARGHS